MIEHNYSRPPKLSKEYSASSLEGKKMREHEDLHIQVKDESIRMAEQTSLIADIKVECVEEDEMNSAETFGLKTEIEFFENEIQNLIDHPDNCDQSLKTSKTEEVCFRVESIKRESEDSTDMETAQTFEDEVPKSEIELFKNEPILLNESPRLTKAGTLPINVDNIKRENEDDFSEKTSFESLDHEEGRITTEIYYFENVPHNDKSSDTLIEGSFS
jgi:hypothetical protein